MKNHLLFSVVLLFTLSSLSAQIIQNDTNSRLSSNSISESGFATDEFNRIKSESKDVVSGMGTAGFVPKWDLSGIVLEDSPIYTMDNKIGIGTISPFGKFTISGTRGGSGGWKDGIIVENTGSNGESAISFKTSATNSNYWIYGLNQNDKLSWTYGTGFNNSITKMVLTANGELGLGTLTPTTKLQVKGVITATGGNSTEWNDAFNWGDHAEEGYLTSQNGGINGSGTVGFIPKWNSESGIEDSPIAVSNDYIGIGTENPSSKLTLTSTRGGHGGWLDGLLLENVGSGGEAAMAFKSSATDTNSWIYGLNQNNKLSWAYGKDFNNEFIEMVLTSKGDLGLGTLSPSSKLHVVGVISATGGNSTKWNAAYKWGNHANAGYITKHNELSGQVVSDSNGITSLTLAAIVEQQEEDSLRAQDFFIFSNGRSINKAPVSLLQNYLQENLDFGSTGAGKTVWTVSGSDIHRVNGNVGIGTDIPGEKLHVDGTILTEGGIQMVGGINKIIFGDSSTSEFQIARHNPSKGTGNPNINTESIFTIDDSDNIGIGTSNPTVQLDVAGDVNIRDSLEVYGSANITGSIVTQGYLSLNNPNGSIRYGEPGVLSDFSLINTAGTIKSGRSSEKGDYDVEVLTIDGEHNYVGILNTNPYTELDVKGTTRTTGFQMTGNAGPDKLLKSVDNDGNAEWVDISEITTPGLWVPNAMGTIAYMDGRVNIGIDNAPLEYKLAVNGTIGCKKIKVELSTSWPDYVFSDSYVLPDLERLEKYVKTNKHLPGVPTESDVKANGIDVGEMNSILLQKIEELTLLLIEQQKQINKQGELIESLNK